LEGTDIPGPDAEALSVRWEVGRLYHGRLLVTRSDEDGIEGLLMSAEGYRRALGEAGGEVRLPYTIHAANLRVPARGNLILG
jgi:hypothetical protein